MQTQNTKQKTLYFISFLFKMFGLFFEYPKIDEDDH